MPFKARSELARPRLRPKQWHSAGMRAALAVLLLLVGTGCEDEPGKDKARAQTSEATPLPALPAGASVYVFDQASSSLEFVGAKVTRRHPGKVASFRGNLQLVGDDITTGAVSIVVDMPSLSVDDDKLTKHLKSSDFLDVTRFPKATFTSTSIQPGGPEGSTHMVTGNLELHGVTKQIVFPAHIKAQSAAVEVTAEFSILRKDFGIFYDGVAGDLIKNDVLLLIRIDARKS